MEPDLHSGSTLSEVMRQRPQTVGVFIALRMACPGCAMSPFETVATAAAEYGLDSDDLLARLAAAPEKNA
jgi:hybrid cluster-associated redox disulfide protein